MKKWKANWEEKQKEILKMERVRVRVRINKNIEYQGEWVNGRIEGLGILCVVDGTY